MTDFLAFLNTADLDTLLLAPGVSRSLAESLIAARPFESAEDCLKVKGMGKTLLRKLELFAEAQEDESENRAMVPVTEEATPAPKIESQPEPEPKPVTDPFLSRLWRAFLNFLRALLKLILLVILFFAIGAMFYYGLPFINDNLIEPVQRDTIRINGLEIEIQAQQTQISEMNSRLDAMQSSIDAQTKSIQNLEDLQTSIEKQLQENNDKALLELKHEVMFSRALDILARGRLYLAQSNFGLAKTDVQSARDLLAELEGETGEGYLVPAIARLDSTIENLPDFPVVASGDLEIAWQILITGNEPVLTATPTLVPLVESPTPTAIATFTPSPVPPPAFTPTP